VHLERGDSSPQIVHYAEEHDSASPAGAVHPSREAIVGHGGGIEGDSQAGTLGDGDEAIAGEERFREERGGPGDVFERADEPAGGEQVDAHLREEV